MGWFRWRRKRRAAGSAAGSPATSGEGAAGTTSDGAAATAAAARTAPAAPTDARQASAAGGPDATAPAFGLEPAAGPVTPVPDRVAWRHLENGAYARLLGPLADDESISALLDHCMLGSQPEAATARALVDRAPRAGDALRLLVGKEDRAWTTSAGFVAGVIGAVSALPAEEAVPLLVRLAGQKSGLTAGSMPAARAAIRALATVPGSWCRRLCTSWPPRPGWRRCAGRPTRS